MIELNEFKRIRRSFGGHASWAYWAQPNANERKSAGIGDLSVFDENQNSMLLDTIHTNYVLMGLNISREVSHRSEAKKPTFFSNFHDSRPHSKDYRLRFALTGTSVWGAYMTDFFVDLVEPKSNKVKVYAKNHPDEVYAQVENRKAELKSVGAERATIIALGNDCHSLLLKHFDGQKIIKLPHYSAYIPLKDYRNQVVKLFENEATH